MQCSVETMVIVTRVWYVISIPRLFSAHNEAFQDSLLVKVERPQRLEVLAGFGLHRLVALRRFLILPDLWIGRPLYRGSFAQSLPCT